MKPRLSAAASLLVLAASLFAIPASAKENLSPPSGDAPPQYSQVFVPFDGTWEGRILFDKEAFLATSSTPADGTLMRIEIHGPVVRVFYQEDNNFIESMPGSFHIDPVLSNAAIFGTHYAVDSWVETWTFAVTQKDDHTLMVEFSRIVNNIGTPPDQPESKFATRGWGELKRVTPPDVSGSTP